MDRVSESDHLSDEELAAETQAGSRSSFEKLVRRYSQRLFHFLRPRMGTDQDTEDLVQDTFLKAYRNIQRFDGRYKFSTWFYTIANRMVIGFYRKNRKDFVPPVVNPTSEDPQEAVLYNEDRENLWYMAQKLRPNQFQALWLRYMEDMSLTQIAGVMKIGQIHARVLLHRARLELAKRLSPERSIKEVRDATSEDSVAFGKDLSFL
jgi:RNA polymerase sigma-70 factor (ECF subfamily)